MAYVELHFSCADKNRLIDRNLAFFLFKKITDNIDIRTFHDYKVIIYNDIEQINKTSYFDYPEEDNHQPLSEGKFVKFIINEEYYINQNSSIPVFYHLVGKEFKFELIHSEKTTIDNPYNLKNGDLVVITGCLSYGLMNSENLLAKCPIFHERLDTRKLSPEEIDEFQEILEDMTGASMLSIKKVKFMRHYENEYKKKVDAKNRGEKIMNIFSFSYIGKIFDLETVLLRQVSAVGDKTAFALGNITILPYKKKVN